MEIEEYKKMRAEKDKHLDYHHFDLKESTRWIGQPTEDLFGEYLTELGLPFQYFPTLTRTDDLDFQIGRAKIDVKGMAVTVDTLGFHRVNVNATQLEKYEDKVNTLVFGTYNKLSGDLYLVGCIELSDFVNRSKFIKKGEPLNKFTTAWTDLYCMQIDCLRPLIDIDRLK